MNELVIVDGYNFIFHYAAETKMDNDSLTYYRDRLINDLAGYKASKNKDVVLVFDARHSNNATRTTHMINQVRIIYSKKGETADTVIEEMVNQDQSHNKIFVVTSDYVQQKVVFRKNVYRLSSREFGLQLNELKTQLRQQVNQLNKQSNTSFYNLGARLNKKDWDDFTKIRNN